MPSGLAPASRCLFAAMLFGLIGAGFSASGVTFTTTNAIESNMHPPACAGSFCYWFSGDDKILRKDMTDVVSTGTAGSWTVIASGVTGDGARPIWGNIAINADGSTLYLTHSSGPIWAMPNPSVGATPAFSVINYKSFWAVAIAVHPINGQLFIGDCDAGHVHRYTAAGADTGLGAIQPVGGGCISNIAFSTDGTLYVADEAAGGIYKVTQTETASPTVELFISPNIYGTLVVDSVRGRLYLSDSNEVDVYDTTTANYLETVTNLSTGRMGLGLFSVAGQDYVLGALNYFTNRRFAYYLLGASAPPGSSNGDPHFVGFQGQVFDITPDVVNRSTHWNWYSDSDVQINLVFETNPEDKRVYIVAASFHFGDGSRVHFQPLPDYKAEATPITSTENGTVAFGACGRLFWLDPQTLVVNWHGYAVQMRTMKVISGSDKQQHLDMSMSRYARNLATVHGLLGQTHRPSTPVPGTHLGEGAIEGVLADYIVHDGRFGTDFRFNRFQAGTPGPFSAEECAAMLASPMTGTGASAAAGAV